MTAPHTSAETRCFDVVVVGSGVAGSAAAMTAARRGAKVSLLEKLPTFGGSAALSAGMFWTAPTVEAYAKRIPMGRRDLAERLVADYPDALAELRSSCVRVADEPLRDIMTFGVGYSTDIISILGWCRKQVVDAGGEVRTGADVTDLIEGPDGISGVVVRELGEEVTYEASAVILASGGFQGAPDELTRHIGRHADRLLLRSNPGSVGDGLRLARGVGAGGTKAMSTFYGHLIGYPVDRFEPEDYLPFSQYYSDSTILVNLRGERFVDETQGDEILNQALTFESDARGVLIFDDHVRRTEGTGEPFPGLGLIDRYSVAVEAGARHAEAATLEELFDLMAVWGIDREAFARTVAAYNESVAARSGTALGVPVADDARPPQSPPFYALMVQPSITFTFGGIRTDPQGQVLDTDGDVLPGLYSAGADIGGLSNYGYAGGLAPGYITGRWAGESAATRARRSTARQNRQPVPSASSKGRDKK